MGGIVRWPISVPSFISCLLSKQRKAHIEGARWWAMENETKEDFEEALECLLLT